MGENRKVSQRGQIGSQGETIACTFLERKGFRVIVRNYRKPWGEIDIIAEKGREVHFVEVKTLSVSDFFHVKTLDHHPEDMVDERKLRKLARTAELYMNSTRDEREFQIDVVGVFLNSEKRIARCRLLEQAL